MARADYFDRALQAAQDVLGGLDQEAFLNRVANHSVGIAFDAQIVRPEAEAAADLFVRLTARFYPKISIVALDPKAKKFVSAMSKLAKRINPNIDIAHSLEGVKDVVVIGATAVSPASDQNVIYLGSNGWIAQFSDKAPVGSGKTGNPLGAGFSACIAAANIFRSVFSSAPRDNHLSISVLDLDPASSEPANPSIKGLDLGEVFLVGAGAIGNGFLWALSRSDAKGRLAVVDHEQIDLGNLQRYVLSERNTVGISKSQFAKHVFRRHPGISIFPVQHRWQDLMESLSREQWASLDKVVVALDTPEDRIGVQASLPRWIINAWTQKGEVGVSRHAFLGQQACMACLYIPKGDAPHLDELVAQALGFPPEALMEVRTLIETGRPLDRATLLRIATAKSIDIGKLMPFEGQPIMSLYTRGVCSGDVFELANGSINARAEVPMPFQSALAGILQAASLFTHVADLPSIPTISQIDLMRPFPPTRFFSRFEGKAGARCICDDADYQTVYREKYGIT